MLVSAFLYKLALNFNFKLQDYPLNNSLPFT